MPGLTIDQLIFKGTHNSYSCRRSGGRLWMSHPPEVQIDDFGVWAIELDYSVQDVRGEKRAVVGHRWPEDASCWGHSLADYAERIVRCKALAHRPVFVCFDVKGWRRPWYRPWGGAVDAGIGYEEKWRLGIETMREVCGERFVLLEDVLAARGYEWPLPGELAGKVVLYEPNKIDDAGRLVGLRGTHGSHFVTAMHVEEAIEGPVALEPRGVACEGGCQVPRLDQYQADWTFAYGVPPNPIVVDAAAPESTLVEDAHGMRWTRGGEGSHGSRVHEQGTYRFPYRSVAAAVERARGVTSATNGRADPRRAGEGWTLLVRSGEVRGDDLPPELGLSVVYEDNS